MKRGLCDGSASVTILLGCVDKRIVQPTPTNADIIDSPCALQTWIFRKSAGSFIHQQIKANSSQKEMLSIPQIWTTDHWTLLNLQTQPLPPLRPFHLTPLTPASNTSASRSRLVNVDSLSPALLRPVICFNDALIPGWLKNSPLKGNSWAWYLKCRSYKVRELWIEWLWHYKVSVQVP